MFILPLDSKLRDFCWPLRKILIEIFHWKYATLKKICTKTNIALTIFWFNRKFNDKCWSLKTNFRNFNFSAKFIAQISFFHILCCTLILLATSVKLSVEIRTKILTVSHTGWVTLSPWHWHKVATLPIWCVWFHAHTPAQAPLDWQVYKIARGTFVHDTYCLESGTLE